MIKLPPNLQEKMDKMANEVEIPHFAKSLSERAGHIATSKDAYYQAYSDLIAELRPVIEAIEGLQCHCHFDCTCGIDKARQALKHLKERILND